MKFDDLRWYIITVYSLSNHHCRSLLLSESEHYPQQTAQGRKDSNELKNVFKNDWVLQDIVSQQKQQQQDIPENLRTVPSSSFLSVQGGGPNTNANSNANITNTNPTTNSISGGIGAGFSGGIGNIINMNGGSFDHDNESDSESDDEVVYDDDGSSAKEEELEDKGIDNDFDEELNVNASTFTYNSAPSSYIAKHHPYINQATMFGSGGNESAQAESGTSSMAQSRANSGHCTSNLVAVINSLNNASMSSTTATASPATARSTTIAPQVLKSESVQLDLSTLSGGANTEVSPGPPSGSSTAGVPMLPDPKVLQETDLINMIASCQAELGRRGTSHTVQLIRSEIDTDGQGQHAVTMTQVSSTVSAQNTPRGGVKPQSVSDKRRSKSGTFTLTSSSRPTSASSTSTSRRPSSGNSSSTRHASQFQYSTGGGNGGYQNSHHSSNAGSARTSFDWMDGEKYDPELNIFDNNTHRNNLGGSNGTTPTNNRAMYSRSEVPGEKMFATIVNNIPSNYQGENQGPNPGVPNPPTQGHNGGPITNTVSTTGTMSTTSQNENVPDTYVNDLTLFSKTSVTRVRPLRVPPPPAHGEYIVRSPGSAFDDMSVGSHASFTSASGSTTSLSTQGSVFKPPIKRSHQPPAQNPPRRKMAHR